MFFKENITWITYLEKQVDVITGLILGLRPANERRRYKVTLFLFG